MRLHYDGEWTDGLRLVERLLIGGHRHDGELDRATAESAIEALELLDLPWMFGEMVEGGERLAEQIHSAAARGLQEIVQNAQDQGARNVRFAWRKRNRGAELLIAHDGDPVELDDVVSMAYPLLSGSRRDAEKIGRFGIGLKTLNQFGDRLEVHCPPLPGFEIEGGHIRRVPDAKQLPGFWDPSQRETLFVLRLKHERFNLSFFRDWIERWDASSLIFLLRLHCVALVDLRSKRSVVEHKITATRSSDVDLTFPRARGAQRVELRDSGSTRRWTLYRVRYPVPREMERVNKALGETVELAVATCSRSGSTRLYAGLPLEEPSTLPFSMAAPFDINIDRTALLSPNPLNDWLLARLGELVAASAEDAFKRRAKDGWSWVPLPDEHAGEEGSELRKQLESITLRVRERIASRVRVPIADGDDVKLPDLLIEASSLEDLFDGADLERLDAEQWGRERQRKRALPSRCRDSGRWREVLAAISGPRPVAVDDALAALDWPDSDILPRGASWLVSLMSAAIDAEEAHGLRRRACLLVEGAEGRLTPDEVAANGRMLVMSLPETGLAASLGLADRIALAFRARNEQAQRVRAWLTRTGILHERAGDAAVLASLATAKGDSPIDLADQPELVRRLRNSFEQLPAETREKLGYGIGRNIKLAAFEYDNDGRVLELAVRPADAYVPYKIEKVEGWPTAAANTPGIRWLDGRYGDWLRTGHDRASAVKRQGALSFLRSLGAAVAPRLHAGLQENSYPHAALPRERLTTHQLDELSRYPKARTLRDDRDSRDLTAVIASITSERTVKERRKRARALFQCLHRAWNQQYTGRDTATAAHHYNSWHHDGTVSATWVGRLASEPWMSTREPKFTPKPPRELAVLTEASFEIEGARPERFAFELAPEDLDSPVLDAIGVDGKPSVDTIIGKLESLRDADGADEPVHQDWADSCYRALGAYCPGGIYENDAELGRTQWRSRFGTSSGKPGLIRAHGRWLSVPDARRGGYLGNRVAWVDKPEVLWDYLDIPFTDVADCTRVMQALVDEHADDIATEIRVMRRLVELVATSRKQLKGIPLRTYQGWTTKRPLYAIRDATLAQAAGEHWPVWRAPISLDEVTPLLSPLGLTLLGENAFSPDVPSEAIAAADLQADFPAIVTHLKNYLLLHNTPLHDKLSPTQWHDLLEAKVALGAGWAVRISTTGRRTLRITPRAHLFRNPMLFCALDDDEAEHREAGGRAIASYFLGDAPGEQDRAFLTLAWESAFRRRDQREDEIDLADPSTDTNSTSVPLPAWLKNRQPGKRIRGGKIKQQPKRAKEQPRELVDLEKLDLAAINATIVTSGRRGQFRAPASKPLAEPKAKPKPKGTETRQPGAGDTHYSAPDREDAGYAIVAAYLREAADITLDDVRSQGDVGADGVDFEKDIWVELKTAGRDRPDTVRFEGSQAKRAKEKGDRYWLAIVWNLEKPRTPELLIVQNPLARLDTYLGAGIKLVGIDDVAKRGT
jgi:hypothetical protein